MKKISLFSTLIFSAICAISVDSEAKEGDKNFLSSDFFSLSKKKESAFDAPSAVYVLSSEDIRRSGVTSIPEALRMVPGIQVSRIDGNKWAISSRGFDRQYSNKLLIMIDGRTVYTPIFSGAFWDNIDYVMSDIEKIEVVHGPGGSIWGANAMDGVINIITKNSAETQGGYISQIVGNNDKSISEARYGAKTVDNNSYRVYAKHALRGGLDKVNVDAGANSGRYVNNDDGIRQDRAGFKYDLISIKDNTVSMHGDFFDSTSQNYLTGLNNPSKNDKTSRGGNLVANWSKTVSKKSSFTLQGYLDYSSQNIQIGSFDEKTVDVDFQHFYNFTKENQFIWGLGYRNTMINTSTGNPVTTTNGASSYYALSYTPNKKNLEIYSAFIQDKIGLIPNTLYLTLGSKFQVNTFTGFEYQPNARLTLYPSRNQTLWAAVSRAVRTPTLGEEYISVRTTSPQVGGGNVILLANQGNTSYKSEAVIAYELGYRVKPTDVTTLDVATFYNSYSHLRTFDGVSGGSLLPVPTAGNNGYGETYGFEVNGKWQVNDAWRLESSYDYLKMTLHLNGASNESTTALNSDPLQQSEGYSPRNQFRIRSLLNLTPKLEFDNMVYYVGALTKTGTVRTDANGVKYYGSGIPAYVRWDTRLGYLMTKNLDTTFGIQNLLDDRHQEFTAGLFSNVTQVGRTYYVKAVLQF